MNKDLSGLLEESISIEMNTASLYRLYSEIYPEHRDFWMRLSMEEMNHASLLKSARQFLKLGKLPDESLFPDMDTMKGLNKAITARLKEFRAQRPDQEKAYRFAHELETSAAEGHFQDTMRGQDNDSVLRIFRKLAGDDLDHAGRIMSKIMDLG